MPASKATSTNQGVKSLTLRRTYLDWQDECLIKHPARRKLIHKGRRLGLTRGMAQKFVDDMARGRIQAGMWGDTVAANIDRYVQRYFMPILKQLPEEVWSWQKQDRLLRVSDAYIDFRSADRPENWEGFGYDLVFLNEAGIILKNRYLWDNAVRPMLLDNPGSEVVIGGTPKGKRYKGEIHKFYELVEYAHQNPNSGWAVFQYSTYDNPLLSTEEIDEMVREMPESVVQQEIYGEFLDVDDSVLIDWWIINEAMRRTIPEQAYRHEPKICGIDVGWTSDPTTMALTQGNHTEPIVEIEPRRDDTLMAGAIARQLERWYPDYILCDYGYATGVISILQQLGWNVIGISFGGKADDPQKYHNKRAEMYDRVRRWLLAGASLPKDEQLRVELASIGVGEDARGRMLLEPKESIKERLGRSPNKGDCIALTRAMAVARVAGEKPLTMAQKDWLEIIGDEDYAVIEESGAYNVDYL